MTSNNPHKYYDWAAGFDYETATEEDYQKLLERSIKPFIKGRNGKDRDPTKNGVIAAFEIGSQGTRHTHHYFSSSSPIRFNSLQKKYPHSDIQPIRGTAQETVDYLLEQNKYEGKNEVHFCEPVTWGNYFIDNKGSAESPPLFEEIDELLAQGLKPRDIYELGSKYAHFRSAIETAYAARRAQEIPHKRDIVVYYHVGLSGTGKSHQYWELCEEHSKEQVYFVNGEYKNAWDFYDYEQIVFLDDLRGTSMTLTALLALLDEYPTILRCRYADKQLAATEFHLTSVIPPERLYSFYDHENFEQLRRRIGFIMYHWRDESITGNVQYRRLVLPASDYVDYKQLIELAKHGQAQAQGSLFDSAK
jgi:hypothetical protein